MSEYKSVTDRLPYAVQHINPQVMHNKVFGAASDSLDTTSTKILAVVATNKPEASWRVEWYVRHILGEYE